MPLHEAFSLIGVLFILASLLCVLGGLTETWRNKTPHQQWDVVHVLGIAGAFVWGLILFGVASWLVSAPFALLLRQ